MKNTTIYRGQQPLTWMLTLLLLLFGAASLFALEDTPALTSDAISKAELLRHVKTLASDEFKGRNSAGEGGLIAAEYLVAEFKKLGLKPAGDDDGYFQTFTVSQPRFFRLFGRSASSPTGAVSTSGPDPKTAPSADSKDSDDDDPPAPMSDQEIEETAKKLCEWFQRKLDKMEECEECECRNVLALLPGSDPKLKDEVIIISAHYDHLGIRNGTVYNGADDNATGTAAVLELARVLKNRKEGPRRSILFAAWDAEEKGLCGSYHWEENPTLPIDQVVAVINLDMIGRMRDDRVLFLGSESSEQLADIITTQAERAKINLRKLKMGGCSDHWPFLEREIPSITLCTGVHKDYHKPTDDTEWIHFTNLERLVRMALGIVSELASRDDRVKSCVGQ